MKLDIEKSRIFHEAAIRISSSLDIEAALWRLFSYLKKFIPMTAISLAMTDSEYRLEHIAHINEEKTISIPSFTIEIGIGQ